MRQQVVPGGSIDALTPAEAEELLQATYRQEVEIRVRAPESIVLDATGGGVLEVYGPSAGWEFEARRVVLDMDTVTDPATGSVALNAAGRSIEYLRSGTRIEWGQPTYGAAVQIPGIQTWGDEQGPYIRNGEMFEVRARGLTANARLIATVEGILRRPPAEQPQGGPAGLAAAERRRAELVS